MNISFNRFFLQNSIIAKLWSSFQSTIKNFSTIIDSKSKKFLMSKDRIRLMRFCQFATQFTIWFLNDDCFKTWNFLCICFFIWSSIYLYLMIKSCKIFLMKIDIHFEKMYVLIQTRIASFTLSILWIILTICFFFV